MANELTYFTPEIWAPMMQETFLKESVALGIANTELRADLRVGDTLHKPYGSYPRVQTYSKGTDITVKDLATTDDYLSVSTAKVASFYVDDIDRLQNKYDTIQEFATVAQRQLNNVIDQAVIAEYSNAGTTLTAVDIGEAAGSISLKASNVANVFTAASRALNSKNRTSPDRFALIGPRMLETLQNYVGGRETSFGDMVGDNGKVGNRFGFKLLLSNNLPFSATLTTSATISNAETVTIAGVTFTFKDTTTGTANEVYSGGTDAQTTTNLVAAINGGTASSTTFVELSAEDRQKLEEAGITAVDGTTYLTITGYGDIVVSETMAQAANVWSVQKQYALFGITGAIDLVTQVEPNIEFRTAEKRLGRYVHPWTLYGKKTFTRNANSLVAVTLDASAWV